MDFQTFDRVLRFLPYKFAIVSGGEPTEHPEILRFLRHARDLQVKILLLSNGVFLHESRCTAILDLVDSVQVTNDLKYYPRHVPIVKHSKVMWETTIRTIFPVGRALENAIEPTRLSPSCFNLRSLTKHFKSIPSAMGVLVSRGMFCTPSINVDGSISAGELPQCESIGTIDDSLERLASNIQTLKCRRCGLYKNLTAQQLQVFES